MVEVVLEQCNLLNNQHQQKSEVLYSLHLNEYYVNLCNKKPSNLVFLKTYNMMKTL